MLSKCSEMSTPVVTPTVVIDRELSDHVKSLRFDAQAFYRFARKAGFTDKEIAAYTIHFSHTSRGELAGRYYPRTRTAEIYLKDILAGGPASTGHLRPNEQRFKPDTQYSKVVSRVVAHETGHHSRSGRTRGRLATAGTHALLAAPVATAGLGMLYTSVSDSLFPPVAAFVAETTAVAALSYHHASYYSQRTKPEKVFSYHRSRFAEKPAVAAESHADTTPFVKIRLK